MIESILKETLEAFLKLMQEIYIYEFVRDLIIIESLPM